MIILNFGAPMISLKRLKLESSDFHTYRSRIRHSWQTHKRSHMDQEYWKHESRLGELSIEPLMGKVFTY